jgi:outer membrane protein assembly factor BamB
MLDQRWSRFILLVLFLGGLAALLGPAALWAQTGGGLPELHPISLVFTPPSPVDPSITSVVVATAQVVNTGSANASSFSVQFSYCIQSQVSLCSENDYHIFGSASVPGLGIGGQANVSAVLNITALTLGLYRVRVVVDPNHQVTQLDPNSNEITALLTIGSVSSGISSVAVDSLRGSNNAVYVGTASGLISAYALDSCGSQGCTTLIWQFTQAKGAIRALVVDKNSHTIYAASDDGTIYALAPDAQPRTNVPTVLWTFSPNARSPIPFLSLALSRASVAPPQGSPTNTQADPLLIYGGTQDGFIYALRSDGTQRWTFSNSVARASNMAIKALAVDRNNQFLYAGTANGVVYAIKPDADSLGQIQAKWDSVTQNNLTAPFGTINILAIDDATSKTYVYAGSDDKNVYSLFGENGQLNWTFSTAVTRDQTGGAVKALGAESAATGGLYVGTSTNLVYGLPFADTRQSGTPKGAPTPILCLTAQGAINAISVDSGPPPGKFGGIALVASQDRNLYVLQTQVSSNTMIGCPQKTTLSSTSRQNPNSSPITTLGPLGALPAIVSSPSDPQLRTILFGATSLVEFEVRYENP